MGRCPTDLTVLAEQRGKAGVTGAFVAALALRGRRQRRWHGMAQLAAKVRFAVPGIAGHALEGAACL